MGGNFSFAVSVSDQLFTEANTFYCIQGPLGMGPGPELAGNVFQSRCISNSLCDLRQIPSMFWILGFSSMEGGSWIRLSLRTPSCCFSDNVKFAQNGYTLPWNTCSMKSWFSHFKVFICSYSKHVNVKATIHDIC